jgi:outer membrane protein W
MMSLSSGSLIERNPAMRTIRLVLAIVVICLASLAPAADLCLERRHQIELRLGMWNQATDARTEIDAGLVTTSVESNGFLGGLAYGHWLNEALALKIGAGAMLISLESHTDASGTTSQTAVVVPIIMGLRHYYVGSACCSATRPFVGVGVGSFIGTQNISDVGSTITEESRTEAVFGGQLEAGIDFLLGRRVMTGVRFAYDLMSDFERPIGGSRNYNGPEFTIGIGFLVGGGV